jgi:heme oxygenase
MQAANADPTGGALMPLSAQLRSETSEAHRLAESSLLVSQILAGTIELRDYCRMMVNLHAIYQELECQLERHAADPAIRHIADVRLARAAAIEQDLRRLMGECWSETFQLEGATTHYLERLATIGERHPARLVAHAYVRYLGDLSGGQIISRAVRPVVGVAADEALHFYDFGSKAEVAELKTRFRDGLDRIEGESDAIIEEALLAFHDARSLFEQLALRIGITAAEQAPL